jgi:hypothetical protein
MADTDRLRDYRVGDNPTLPGSDKRYLQDELRRISDAIGIVVEVMKKLEARMVAHGI